MRRPKRVCKKKDHTSTLFRCALRHLSNSIAGVTVSDRSCDTVSGGDIFDYIATFEEEFGCRGSVKPPSGVSNTGCNNFTTLLEDISTFASNTSAIDHLIWQFSMEQNSDLIHDLCMGNFYSTEGSQVCGEPNGLGIMSVQQTVEWFHAVKNFFQKLYPTESTSDVCQYTGFYQTELLPLHFVTNEPYNKWWKWLSGATQAGYQDHFNNMLDTSLGGDQHRQDYYDHFNVSLPTSFENQGNAPRFDSMAPCPGKETPSYENMPCQCLVHWRDTFSPSTGSSYECAKSYGKYASSASTPPKCGA